MPSTVISRFDYDSERRILSVWFRPSGRHYEYLDVPRETYFALRRAASKGRFFNAHIRDHFLYRQLAA